MALSAATSPARHGSNPSHRGTVSGFATGHRAHPSPLRSRWELADQWSGAEEVLLGLVRDEKPVPRRSRRRTGKHRQAAESYRRESQVTPLFLRLFWHNFARWAMLFSRRKRFYFGRQMTIAGERGVKGIY